MDLTLKFSRQEIAVSLGAVSDGDVITLTLNGELLDGTPFNAKDCITVLDKEEEPPSIADNGETFLYPAAPNPFNPITTIRFNVHESGNVSLKVYDVAGRLVRTLVNEVRAPNQGGHEAIWNGRDNGGRPVASGVYFYRLVTRTAIQTKKMILMK